MRTSICHPDRPYCAKGLCRECYTRLISKRHYTNNKEKYLQKSKDAHKASPEKRREYTRRWAKNNPEKIIYLAAKDRAKRRGLAFTLAFSDVVIPAICPVLGIVLSKSESGRQTDSSPSLDRVDNAKGYVSGNVIVVSNRANRLKGDGTPQELRKISDFYAALQ